MQVVDSFEAWDVWFGTGSDELEGRRMDLEDVRDSTSLDGREVWD